MKKEAPKSTLYLLPIILTALALLIYILYLSGEDDRKYIKKINKEFKKPLINDSISGRIFYIEPAHPNVKNTASQIILNNNQKIWLRSSDNHSYEISNLCDYIKINDSIVKNRGSDTLYVFRERSLKFFVLGKSINYKSHE